MAVPDHDAPPQGHPDANRLPGPRPPSPHTVPTSSLHRAGLLPSLATLTSDARVAPRHISSAQSSRHSSRRIAHPPPLRVTALHSAPDIWRTATFLVRNWSLQSMGVL